MLKNTRILYRIALVALLPLVSLATLAFYDIAIKWVERSEIARMQPVAEGVGKLSRLVHELQRERGVSSLFLNSKVAQMRAGLLEQRKGSDAERVVGLRVLDDLKRNGGGELASAAQASVDALSALDQRRSEIDSQVVSPAAAVGYLTDTINRLVSVITGISKFTTDDDISKTITAYANLIEGKERAGLERATVAGASR